MKLRSQTLTALRALLDLCVYSAPNVPTSLGEIARRQQLSVAFLEQLFRRLKSAGLVSPSRGMKGGYILTRMPQAISVLEIFQALEDPLVAQAKSKAQRAEISVLLGALGEVAQTLEAKLGALSLEDLKHRALEHPELKGMPRVGAGFSI